MNILSQIGANKNIFKPVIYGLSSTVLSEEEKSFFSRSGAVGFILFSRNIENKEQLKKLTKSLRDIMQGEVLILIDQEGGRVCRMQQPSWPKYPAGKYFADIYQQDSIKAKHLIYQNFQNIANDLFEVGVNVNCAPVIDVLQPQTHQVIGDRAYGDDCHQVSDLSQEVCKALLSRNVYPVIKHIPGHGRALCDSHLELPKVSCSIEDLRRVDFRPFIDLNQQKFAMTAHILYDAIDCENCATTSSKVINLIRDEIGFKNILMSDDISMKALKGGLAEKTKQILQAGCDLVLHCNGNMNEMQEIDKNLPLNSDELRLKFS